MKTDSIVFNQGIYETAKHYNSREINRLKTNFSKLNSMPRTRYRVLSKKQ